SPLGYVAALVPLQLSSSITGLGNRHSMLCYVAALVPLQLSSSITDLGNRTYLILTWVFDAASDLFQRHPIFQVQL
ncbi:hypothetical protein BDV36DRAFT_262858, partial [Aspergillus pseudocaelatus]